MKTALNYLDAIKSDGNIVQSSRSGELLPSVSTVESLGLQIWQRNRNGAQGYRRLRAIEVRRHFTSVFAVMLSSCSLVEAGWLFQYSNTVDQTRVGGFKRQRKMYGLSNSSWGTRCGRAHVRGALLNFSLVEVSLASYPLDFHEFSIQSIGNSGGLDRLQAYSSSRHVPPSKHASRRCSSQGCDHPITKRKFYRYPFSR